MPIRKMYLGTVGCCNELPIAEEQVELVFEVIKWGAKGNLWRCTPCGTMLIVFKSRYRRKVLVVATSQSCNRSGWSPTQPYCDFVLDFQRIGFWGRSPTLS